MLWFKKLFPLLFVLMVVMGCGVLVAESVRGAKPPRGTPAPTAPRVDPPTPTPIHFSKVRGLTRDQPAAEKIDYIIRRRDGTFEKITLPVGASEQLLNLQEGDVVYGMTYYGPKPPPPPPATAQKPRGGTPARPAGPLGTRRPPPTPLP